MKDDPFAAPEEEEEVKENPFALTKPDEVGSGVEKASVDVRIATAHTYPRNFERFMEQAMFEATYNTEVAEEMWYSRQVSDKKDDVVEGPSVRLAEIVAKAYGNLDFGFDIIGHDGKMIKAEGWCWDMEQNNRARVTVTRRITTKSGRTFGDSMIQTTGLAAGSIALRNAIFKIVPAVLVKEILKAAKKKFAESVGEDMEAAVKRALEWFNAKGIEPEVVLKMLGRESIGDITAEDVVELRGTVTAINGGDLTVQELLKKHGGVSRESDEDAPGLADRLRREEGEPSEDKDGHA